MTLDSSKYPLLSLVDEPAQLRDLAQDKLPAFSKELREYLLNSVSQSSGHLASGLGTVELTVALHYVYNTPEDRLVWDVGHQAYPHKILTGRRDQMHTIRQKDGLHPFPFREESPYDTFSVGHSSTSISAALGMAIAAEKEGKDRKTVAVIGDGAITAGMAFEAMNHMGDVNPNVLIILNDNEMSISENVGALNNHFARILSGSFYTNIREGSKKLLSGLPPVKELASRMEEHLKGMVIPGTFFEELGLNYIGPIDGHDVNMMVDTLRNMRNLKGPQLLHIKTQKGKGYKPAEADPIGYHGVPKFDPSMSKLPKSKPGAATFSNVFGDWLCDMAAQDDKLMAITPAMREGSGMVRFSKEYPAQYFDVAIAEQHAVTLAAGLACEGLKPVVAIYSSFLQRAYDQLIHDVALQNLPVLFAIDRAGIVGADGETHQGAYDLSFMRCIPNMIIMAPSDTNECRQMLYTGYQCNQPVAVRYPRGSAGTCEVESTMSAIEIGKARSIKQGNKVAILSFGTLLENAKVAADELNATVIDMRFIKPLDTDAISKLLSSHDVIVTLEDNAIAGGAGSAVNEYLAAIKADVTILNLGIPDEFIKHGTQDEMHAEMGLDANGILTSIKEFMA
ncbi:1-deoxy-D-xylulose-5-phosphate synthase [Pseudoalteromonas shioyasakiensis]|uniref:1-deoxy-D-xylulose-5-phosphate synthase n=1 Tax=Pseudoalteromonas shioyasakiensis TaxID=1190813 RepID=A0ABT6U4T1_9GAMM|nr:MULTISPECIES: 1-deoxy-D-xylulose-5-phosphate synthase [Pseudoalteromonas]MDI4671174.1 1-deoxy-D-xylulose-5-phosphate synthase [Pseudoalteromonas shioyasakiensis]MDI4672100.1 1-deoxy-D-xylulose-5-phosphate synthase [Pseudoalteromonas shioyasakiensis]MDI4688083.1 1-deoxy-D-xylulose-5-phosphate synthase [Pseudoalteromonas shioyasakiensis]MDI4706679.1 1-deoxy-D-xylulose-5-phosphate synthase [Pseudoalteromonas shioyasakiensis]NUJ23138.1 1-deoxy-D-xylulose-5-phosphate synthase [Pseudoalteromonas 